MLLQDCGNTFPSKRKFKAHNLVLHQHIQNQQDPAGTLAIFYKKELDNSIAIAPHMHNRIMPVIINNKIQVINMYVQKYNKEFINEIITIQSKKPTILMGDFNSYSNPSLDRLATYNTKSQPHSSNQTVKQLLKENLIDTFRQINPNKRKFTLAAI